MAKRILVVEDNDLNRKLFCDVLKANGYEVVPVADGQNVLGTAKRFQPHLVIMDIQLPNVSGIDLIAELKGEGDLAKGPLPPMPARVTKNGFAMPARPIISPNRCRSAPSWPPCAPCFPNSCA